VVRPAPTHERERSTETEKMTAIEMATLCQKYDSSSRNCSTCVYSQPYMKMFWPVAPRICLKLFTMLILSSVVCTNCMSSSMVSNESMIVLLEK